MGLKRVSWVRRYQGQCRALRPLGHQGYRLRNHKKDQPLCSGYTHVLPMDRAQRGLSVDGHPSKHTFPVFWFFLDKGEDKQRINKAKI